LDQAKRSGFESTTLPIGAINYTVILVIDDKNMMDVFYIIIHKLFLFDELFSLGVTAVVATILTISLVSTKVRSLINIIK
jgi:hypothetical protein